MSCFFSAVESGIGRPLSDTWTTAQPNLSEGFVVFVLYNNYFFPFFNGSGVEDLRGLEDFSPQVKEYVFKGDGRDGDRILVANDFKNL